MTRIRPTALASIPLLTLLGLWIAFTSGHIIDPVFLPSPAETVKGFVSLLSIAFLRNQLLPSLIRIGAAFLISVALAFPVGVVAGQSSVMASLVNPICGFTRYLPIAALVPLCILWFGIDDAQKIAVITIGVVFQLTLLIAADSAAVPKELIETSRTFGLSKFQILCRVVIPWAMPSIWDDLRVSAGWAWSYLVLAELVAGSRGVGYFIVESQRYLNTEMVFAGIIFVGLLGLLTDVLFRMSATRLFSWR